MKVSKIESLDLTKIYKILTSSRLTVTQKEKFVRQYSLEIKSIINTKISNDEFKQIMTNRPLIKFRPFKNSFTKAGDKKILAKTLGIKSEQVVGYIANITEDLRSEILGNVQSDKLDTIKTYVYRHGKQDELVAFLDYELKTAKNVLTKTYETLDYHKGGVADYFVRPIHRMNNKTLVSLYEVIDKHLSKAQENGQISISEHDKTAKWALVQIYKIQNNSKLINAIRLRKELV